MQELYLVLLTEHSRIPLLFTQGHEQSLTGQRPVLGPTKQKDRIEIPGYQTVREQSKILPRHPEFISGSTDVSHTLNKEILKQACPDAYQDSE